MRAPSLGVAALGALALGFSLCELGCGAAPAAGMKAHDAAGPDEQYETLEQAAAAFEHYASELESPYAQNDGALASSEDELAKPSPAPPPPPVTASAPSASSAPRPSSMQPGMAPSQSPYDTADRAPAKHAQEKEESPAKQKDSCETPCKAFASMKRAGDAICRLDAQGGSHCKQAKQRIAVATDRLASCACAS